MNVTGFVRVLVVALVIGVVVDRSVQAALVMKIDTNNETFFIDGSDTGSAEYVPNDFFSPELGGTYFLQFIHYFSTAVPQSATVTSNPQNFFVEATPLSMYGGMNIITNFGQNYVFMDLGSGSSDITSLTAKGPSAAVSYAGLPAADIPVFESLIGNSLVLSTGTGYSSIPVILVPEPSTWVVGAAGIACAGRGAFRRRKRA